MSAINRLIDALHDHKVHSVGRGSYRARCPVCGVTSNSTLKITEQTDGAVLVKCFKFECPAEEIVAAVGLDLSDLFPPRESHGSKGKRRRLLTDREALDMLDHEAHVLVLVASDIQRGADVTVEDCARLITATARISYLRQEARA
jgi:hypothetical protein